MPSGPNFPSTVTSVANGTSVAWSNPANAKLDDGSFATVAPAGSHSDFLFATGFGFAIPTGATILGVFAEVHVKASLTGFAGDFDVELIVGGTNTVGSDKGSGATIPTALTWVGYGGSTDLWNQSLTYSDVNASNFGLAYSVSGASTDVNSVDAIRITVYYAQHYTSSQTATLSLHGAIKRAMTLKAKTATTSFSGGFAKTGKPKTYTPTLAFAGAHVPNPRKALRGSLTTTGAMRRAFTRLFSPTLTFLITYVPILVKPFVATLTSAGDIAHLPSKVFQATLPLIADASHAITRSLDVAALTLASAFVKSAQRSYAAAVGLQGAISRALVLSLVSVLILISRTTQALSRALSGTARFSGAVVKLAGREFLTALGFVGAITLMSARALLAALSFTGTILRAIGRSLMSASLTFSSASVHFIDRVLTGALTFLAALAKPVNTHLSALLSLAGSTVPGKLLTSVVAFAGTTLHRVTRSLAATLSFTAVLAGLPAKVFQATLTFTTSLPRYFSRAFTATLALLAQFEGVLLVVFTAALSFAGSIFNGITDLIVFLYSRFKTVLLRTERLVVPETTTYVQDQTRAVVVTEVGEDLQLTLEASSTLGDSSWPK